MKNAHHSELFTIRQVLKISNLCNSSFVSQKFKWHCFESESFYYFPFLARRYECLEALHTLPKGHVIRLEECWHPSHGMEPLHPIVICSVASFANFFHHIEW